MSIVRLVTGLVLASFLVLAGCTKEKQPEAPAHVKILTEFEDMFEMEYGRMLASKFPDTEFEVVGWQLHSMIQAPLPEGVDPGAERLRRMKQIVDEEKPDLFFSQSYFSELAREGKFVELEPFIKADELNLDELNAHVVADIRRRGGGKLYGLAPKYSARALFYNKELFDEQKIPYPEGLMSWEGTLKLAERFAGLEKDGKPLYGLTPDWDHYFNHEGYLMLNIGWAEGLQAYDDNGTAMSIRTEPWKRIAERVVQSVKAGVVQLRSGDDSPIDRVEQFKHSAMYIAPYEFTGYLKDEEQRDSDFQWGVTTVPVNPTNPVNVYMVDKIAAIVSGTPSPNAVWEIVRYLNGEEMAKQQAKLELTEPKLLTYSLPESEMEEWEAPFRALEPKQVSEGGRLSPQFSYDFAAIAAEELRKTVEERQSLDEALQFMHERGTQLLSDYAARDGNDGEG